MREFELVHGLRRAKRSPRGRKAPLWPVSRPTATRHIAKLMTAAGIEGPQACPKGLRHAYGVAAVAAGVPLPTVAAVLGHASLTTTAIYTTAIGAEARDLVGVQSGRGRNPTPSTWAPGTAQDARRHGERHVCIGILHGAGHLGINQATHPPPVRQSGRPAAGAGLCKILLGR